MDAHSVVDARSAVMQEWLSGIFQAQSFSIAAITGDASFRRYYRLRVNAQSFIVMDAPPDKENCRPFVAIASAFQQSTVRFPTVLSADFSNGFLLLSDFGDQQLLPLLNAQSVDLHYQSAMDLLLPIQQCNAVPNYTLPYFDDALFWREFDIFYTWYIQKNKGYSLSSAELSVLKNQYQQLIHSALSQPRVFVHRDYHSRNIMLCEDHQLGILDFQDAVMGPVTYDLVSLLKDCYIAWSDEKISAWVFYFYQQSPALQSVDFHTVMRWFDWMGLQRHLKCLGIFSRLHYRDHKDHYLKEIPRVLQYAMRVCDQYPELSLLKKYLQ